MCIFFYFFLFFFRAHLCITEKISQAKLAKILPMKIFRKCPCLSIRPGGIKYRCFMIDTNYTAVGKFSSSNFLYYFFLIETVENKRFLHAEIHPINVMSDQIEKLHSHLLRTKMVRKILKPIKFHILKLNAII